jgi:histidinol phosphatase-like enzyme (inositol monophosphatase family)
MKDLNSFLEFAVDACQQAGKITLNYFQKNLQIDYKADESPVTIADRSSETRIRELIQKRFPDHAIIGEEFGQAEKKSSHIWYIDPIDGTLAYVHGVPIYGVMLGLEIENEVVVGVVNFPALNEMAYAAKGQGCFWNGVRCSVRTDRKLNQAVLCHSGTEYYQNRGRLEAYRELEKATLLQRTWGDCYGHILVATGRADVCIDPVLHSWDAAPLIPILQEAGGTFTDWKGVVTAHHHEGISANAELLPEILSITSRYDATEK